MEDRYLALSRLENSDKRFSLDEMEQRTTLPQLTCQVLPANRKTHPDLDDITALTRCLDHKIGI
jgi:hypothetical protein